LAYANLLQSGKENGGKKTTHESNKDWVPWGWDLFFVFFVFLVSCFFGFFFGPLGFLVFWFVVGFLKGWQSNTKVKDLDLALCQFSHFRGCKLAFGRFYWLLWACGSIRKPCKKKQWQNAGITGGSLGGLGHRLGNFVCLYNCSKLC